MQTIDKLELIKEKIIKTDEVIKLLCEKNQKVVQLTGKYQMLLSKYQDKNKLYQKLKEECDILCMSNDEQQTQITKLEEELSSCKSEHNQLQTTYVEYVNSSQLKYKSLDQELQTSENKIKELEKQISLLNAAIADGQTKCYSCGRITRNTKRQKSDLETVPENGVEQCTKTRKRKISFVESDADMSNDQPLLLIEAKSEISSLQNELSLVRLDNTNLRTDFKNLEIDCNTLREDNVSLKRNVKEKEKKNDKLQERLNALLLEMEVINFDCVEKHETRDIGIQTEVRDDVEDAAGVNVAKLCDIGIQTDVIDEEEDAASVRIERICDELIYLPRIVSPIHDFVHNEDISGLQEANAVEPDSLPDFDPYPILDSPINDEERTLLAVDKPEILNTSVFSTHSEKLLDSGRISSKCCTAFTASMQEDNVSGESRLLGFLPVEEECGDLKIAPKKNKKFKRGLMRQCSEQIYKRVLKDVLKYIHSSKRKLNTQRNKKKIVQKVKNKIVARKIKQRKRKQSVTTLTQSKNIHLESKQTTAEENNSNDVTTPTECNTPQHSYFCYDIPPASVDSGYCAQSDGSEILSCQFSGSVSELSVQSFDSCDAKKRKLELFGSDSESDCDSAHSRNSNLIKIAPAIQILDSATEQSTKENGDSMINSNCEKRLFKRSNCVRKSNKQSIEKSDEKQKLLAKPVLLPSNKSVDSDGTKQSDKQFLIPNSIAIKPIPKPDNEKRVFKRPNCRKRIIETPRSPEPSQEEELLPHKPVIIPLNKPRKLREATISKLFEKLLTYPDEPQVLEEVADKLANQESAWISRAVINLVSSDYHNKVENKDNPFAPMLTKKQKVLLGFMIKMERKNTSDMTFTFMNECEKCILQQKSVEQLIPLTRLYLAVCKLKRDVYRMRKTCLDAVYFMGDLVIPFLYTVLSSWAEVLPNQNDATLSILPKVIVQVINLKTCNFPGYNLLNLRTIISRLHGYPSERWNSDDLFTEIASIYTENPDKQDAVVALQILCKNHSASWVAQQLEKLTNTVLSADSSMLKERTIDVLDQIIKQFDAITDASCIEKVEKCQSILSDGFGECAIKEVCK